MTKGWQIFSHYGGHRGHRVFFSIFSVNSVFSLVRLFCQPRSTPSRGYYSMALQTIFSGSVGGPLHSTEVTTMSGRFHHSFWAIRSKNA